MAPATGRNRDPILEVLRRLWPAQLQGIGAEPLHILEIASGTGEHAVHFARELPHLHWQPTDLDDAALASIAAWQQETGLPNLAPPLRLDVCGQPWPDVEPVGIFCANMIHIAPWPCTLGLVAGAGRLLPPGGLLVLYGPFMVDGQHTAPSNAAFDLDLRARDPRWGVREIGALGQVAADAGLRERERVEMPANNLVVVFARR